MYWSKTDLFDVRFRYIQGVSRLLDITAGGDFLGLCDQKISYKHVSDFERLRSYGCVKLNRLTPNDTYMDRTTPLTSKRYILYIYSTNICTEYFKHALYSPFLSLQNAVCFIMLTCLIPVLFTFYIQGVLKLKK